MSFSFVTPCNEVLNSFVLLIEGNIEQPQIQLIEVHVAECPACNAFPCAASSTPHMH